MITLLFMTKLTTVLLIGTAGFLLSQKMLAASRHLLCLATLALSLLLPVTLAFPTLSQTPPITFVVHASSAISSSYASSLRTITLIWLAGMLFVAARFVCGAAYFAWRMRRSRAAIQFPFSCLPVRFTETSTPVLWGWIKPAILMPNSSIHWSPERQLIAIQHELAHYRRRDNWTALIALAAQAMYWFHPLVWWLKSKAEEQRELACDDRVLSRGTSPSEYAELLIDLARQHPLPAPSGCAMFRNSTLLKGRIMHILNFRKPESCRTNLFAMASALLVMLLGCLLIPASADQQKIYKIGGDVTAPKVLYKIEPDYAPQPKRDKIQGSVLLELTINAEGQPQDIRVLRSLNPDLDQNAVSAVSQWQFQPATKNGTAVPVEAKIEVDFRLK